MTETEQKTIFENWLSLHKGLLFKVVTHQTESIDNIQYALQESKTPMDERLAWLY